MEHWDQGGVMVLFAQILLFAFLSHAQEVVIDVALTPAGSFKAQTKAVQGVAKKKGAEITAENILVDVRTLKTGMSLRDKHLKERLEADKFPFEKLISASGKDGKGKGILEIKGKRIEVNGAYSIEGKILKATFKVNLPALQIKDIRYMSVGVEDTVELTVKVPLQG